MLKQKQNVNDSLQKEIKIWKDKVRLYFILMIFLLCSVLK